MGDTELRTEQIKKFLPHRYPFLLIDRVSSIQAVGDLKNIEESKVGTKVVAVKNVSANEPFFQGHFPDYPIMPGVLITEAMAQASCFAVYPYIVASDRHRAEDFQCALLGVDGARFRRPVVPGDVLVLDSEVTKHRGKMWGFHVNVNVDGQKVAEADILAHMTLKEN